MRDLISSGDLMRLFLEGDPNTIIRRPNVRRFAQENGVRHIICNGKWLIDYKEFFKQVNPRRIRRTATMPRLRCLRDCVTEFNKNNRKFKIDKATVSHYMKSAQVTRYFHGNTWFINYDELEKVILRHLKAVKKKEEKKIQLNIEKGRTVRLALLNYLIASNLLSIIKLISFNSNASLCHCSNVAKETSSSPSLT